MQQEGVPVTHSQWKTVDTDDFSTHCSNEDALQQVNRAESRQGTGASIVPKFY